MSEIQHCSFKIEINDQYTMKCTIASQKSKEVITLDDKDVNKENIPITIQFKMNEIIVCQKNSMNNSIEFMKDWIDNPNDYKYYQITYQNKSYSVIAEVLFGLIIYQYKSKIEKEYIIDNVTIKLQHSDLVLEKRMKISMESIGFTDIIFTSKLCDYQEQGEIMNDILDHYEEFKKY